ncbi:hypothetical protein BKA70DRAFT_1308840 [Coprinopsis sp. MPI-PUGE-AT-0042]|nr:hypothetical protein BKA70DRAFT_1308840 [Coprinopsis sp. MPI-PUGE-AT-0042]
MNSETTYASVDEARRLLDDRVLALEKQIVDIKHQRNQLAPTSRLPVEILTKIFLDQARSAQSPPQAPQHGSTGINSHPSTMWMGISHVCRQWREVALSCSELWSVLNPGIPTKWIEAMIERSKAAPISILNFDISYNQNPKKREILLKVLSEPGRWRRIQLHPTHIRDEVVKLMSRITSPAPSLVELSVNFDGGIYGLTAPRVLPWNFLGASAPSLRRLEMVHCHPSWNPKLFSSSLISLKLSNPPLFKSPLEDIQVPSCPSPRELAEVLDRIPLLTELDLDMKIPDMTTLSPTGRTFGFPHLQKLCLVGECEELAGLLGCLRIPPTAHVEVNCTKASEMALLPLGWALDKAWVTKPVIDRVSLWQPPAGGSRIEGSNASSPGINPLLISITRISNWKWETFPEPRSLLAAICWDHVETLSVECSLGEGAEWKTLFEKMKRVKNLKLFDESVQEFIKALTHLTRIAGSPPGLTNFADTVPLPYLETLMIRRANIILSSKNLSRYGPNTQAMTVTFQDLVEWMQKRRVLGASKLKEVTFKDCGGFSQKVKELLQKLQELGAVENLKRMICRVEVDDFDARSESEEADEDEDDCDEGFCYASGDSDDDVCNACLEPGCEGECEIYI